MNTRDQFEQAYAQHHNCTVAWCEGQRTEEGDYRDRFMRWAWQWWQRGKEAA